jgi:hypothetical protein
VPVPTPRQPAPPEDDAAWNAAWVPGVLFLVVLLAGLALLVATLAPQLFGLE